MELPEAESSWMQHRLSGRIENHRFVWVCGWLVVCFGGDACVLSTLQSCPTLCDPMGCSPPGFLLHGMLQARVLQGVARPSFRQDLPDPGMKSASLTSPALAGKFFTIRATWEAPTNWLLP